MTTPSLGAAVILLLAALIPGPVDAFQQKKSTGKTAPDAFLNGPPFTFEQVVRLIREDVIPQRRQREAIQNRGLNFSLSSEQTEVLKNAGASAEMLDLIQQRAIAAPPPKPAPAPRPQFGEVNISCAPAECSVSIAGVPKGATVKGILRIQGLRAGNTAVDLTRTGYVSAQSLVNIEVGRTASIAVTLEPDRTTKETFGQDLFNKMIESLGGEAAIREALWIQAQGSVVVWTPDGKSTKWATFMRGKPDRYLFQVRSAGGVFHEIEFVGSQFKTSKGLKGNEARDLTHDFELVRDYQLGKVIERLNTPKFKMLSSGSANANNGWDLVAEATTETISITLDSEFRPAKIRFGTATGLGDAILTFADYTKKAKTSHPNSMQFRPDATPHGIEVIFDRVEINPKLKDADYTMKGKPLSTVMR